MSQLTVQPAAGTPQPAAPPSQAAVPGQYDPEYPLLGRILEIDHDRLLAQRRYDPDIDLFLQDHAVGGAPSSHAPRLRALQVMPFTFSMEVAAEAARRLAGGGVVRGMREVRGHRWLTVDQGSFELRIVATRGGEGSVSVKLHLLGDDMPPGGMVVFETEVLLGPDYEAPPAPLAWPDEPSQPALRHDDATMYTRGMFHGPRLQCVKHLRRWSPTAIECDLHAHPTHDFFSFTAAPKLQIDAALLDAAGQMAGYWLVENHAWDYNCFPFRCERFSSYGAPPPPGTRLVGRGRIESAGEERLRATFDLFTEDGRLLLRLEGWHDRKFAVPPRYFEYRLQPQTGWLSTPLPSPAGSFAVHNAAFPEGFLDIGHQIWMRVLAHMVLGERERLQFYALPRGGARREEWLMGRIAAKDAVRRWAAARGLALAPADVEILNDAQGRPQVHCPLIPGAAPRVSLSHSARAAAAIAIDAGFEAAIDLEAVGGVDVDALQRGGLSAEERALLAVEPQADRAVAALALWCAKEAAAKLHGGGLDGRPMDWRVTELKPPRADERGRARVRFETAEYQLALQLQAGAVIATGIQAGAATPRAASLH